MLKFLDWAFKNGGKIATELEYVPLPPKVQDVVRATWMNEIKN